jgi:hypothetical protein
VLRAFLVDLWTAYPGSRVTAEEIVAERDRLALRYLWRAGGGPWPTVAARAFIRFSGVKMVECWQGVLTDAPAPDPVAQSAARRRADGSASPP